MRLLSNLNYEKCMWRKIAEINHFFVYTYNSVAATNLQILCHSLLKSKGQSIKKLDLYCFKIKVRRCCLISIALLSRYFFPKRLGSN